MESKISRFYMRILAALALSAGMVFGAFAQTDPDPNSPTPVLLTTADSNRALAHSQAASRRVHLARESEQAFYPESKVTLYVTNLALTDGEGANAFRVYAENAKGQMFRFPVLDISPIADGNGIYAATVFLQDEIGYWPAPSADGQLTLYLTWRGLASNRVTLGLGSTDSRPVAKTDSKDRPAPLSMALDKKKVKEYAASLSPEYVGYRWSGDRARFLEQAAFGPNTAMDNRIRRIGLRTWLAEQFEIPYPSAANPFPNDPLKPVNAPADCDNEQTITPDVPVTCFRDTYSMYKPQTWFFKEAFYSDAQLRHRMVWALSQIWVTSGVEIQQGRQMTEFHKLLANNAFGNYRTLMKQMTLSPAMGQYLDMAISTKTNPNENYAREIKQLFTIGLFMLNQDGTVQTDLNGSIPTYDQNVVNSLTKVLTGWNLCSTSTGGVCPNLTLGVANYIDPMLLNTNNHDLTAKTLLSYPGSTTTSVAACPGTCATVAERTAYANASLEQALDNVYNHPNVGPFVSKNLIQQMVTSDPTPAYVSRVAAVFNSNRANPSQMKEVVKAILLDAEARGDIKTDPNYGKLREPVQFFTNYARTFGVRSADGLGLSDGNVSRGRSEFNNMAQVPFFSPTVFNYFPPDYKIPGTASLGPEFAIMTTGTAIARANFVNRVVFSVVNPPSATSAPFPVSGVDTPNGTSFDFSDLIAIATADPTSNQLLDELNRRMLHSTMTAQNKSTIMTAVNSVAVSTPPTAAQALSRVQQAVYLIAASSQYQVQR